MKILEVTFETPSVKSGGGLGIIQSVESLQRCGEVDYIGPEFEKDTIDVERINVKGFLCYSARVVDRCKSMIDGVTNGYYQSWKRIEKTINWKLYDLVSVEFTRFPFVIESAKKNNIPVIIRMHNVEKDYFHNIYCLKRNLSCKFQELFYSYQEKKSIELCDGVLALSCEDKNRIIELFGEKYSNKIIVNPVCIKDKIYEMNNKREGFLITGSLWYGPNADGVVWFLKNVWSVFSEHSNDTLIIAGAKPNDEIKHLVNQYNNIQLIENPKDITPYFKRAKCYIAPIFSGAGMKVKIAEAMMYGIPVLASKHALIGYNINRATKEFFTSEELIEGMMCIMSATEEEIGELCKLQRKNFVENYTIENSVYNYKRLINSVTKQEEMI